MPSTHPRAEASHRGSHCHSRAVADLAGRKRPGDEAPPSGRASHTDRARQPGSRRAKCAATVAHRARASPEPPTASINEYLLRSRACAPSSTARQSNSASYREHARRASQAPAWSDCTAAGIQRRVGTMGPATRPAFVLALLLASPSCDDEAPPQDPAEAENPCLDFLRCYASCRAPEDIAEDPYAMPSDPSQPAYEVHQLCFDVCGGDEVSLDAPYADYMVYPLENISGSRWTSFDRCLSPK